MGRGGRGGGGGGHSFSSGGSRGFSSHSSSHSSRGGYGGSRSGGSFGGGYHGGYHHHNYGYYNGFYGGPRIRNNYYFTQPGMTFNATGWLLHMVKLFVIGILMFVVLFAMSYNNGSSEITRSTVKREKLDPSYVKELDEYYTDDLGWIGSSFTLESGMKDFYRKTGVQPYLYICDSIDGNVNSQADQEAFGNKMYDSLFDDEGHALLVFCEYSSGDYVSFLTVGNAAKTVLDEEGREILLDYVDHYYYSDYEDDEFFSLAFEKAGDRMMTVQKSHTWIVVLVIVVLVGLIILFRQLEKKSQEKADKMRAAQDILNTPINEFGDNNAENLAGKYENRR